MSSWQSKNFSNKHPRVDNGSILELAFLAPLIYFWEMCYTITVKAATFTGDAYMPQHQANRDSAKGGLANKPD